MTITLDDAALIPSYRGHPRFESRTISVADASLDIAEQVARVLRSQEETQKFVSEQRKLMAEEAKLNAEATKLIREEIKLGAEAAKLRRDRELSLWQVMIASMAAGAALFGAGAAFIKLLSP